MTPVFPYLVRRTEDGWRGELLLRLRDGKSAYILHLALDQARALAVEMRGLATDHCPQHHLALLIARALEADISHVVLKRSDPSGGVVASIRMVTTAGLREVDVDAAAALGMAVHMGLPIFMDGDFTPSDGTLHAIPGLTEAPVAQPQIPQAFRKLIAELDLPTAGEETEG